MYARRAFAAALIPTEFNNGRASSRRRSQLFYSSNAAAHQRCDASSIFFHAGTRARCLSDATSIGGAVKAKNIPRGTAAGWRCCVVRAAPTTEADGSVRFVTEKVGSMVRVAPLGISSPGGIATLVSIAPGKGVTAKFQISKTEQLVHPSQIGTADCNSQLFASALRSTRSVSSGARNIPPPARARRARPVY